jgi:hypothetical protein
VYRSSAPHSGPGGARLTVGGGGRGRGF